MEACEILGGEACNARMFPEAKLAAAVASEEIDREYLEYNDPKTLPCKAPATISAASSAKPSTRMASTYTALHMAGVGFPVDDE
ncbi:hypothetical protein BHE74_00024110 [Ensete ventricosum]|nr:hypothetical protein GW17_00028764 [Ensete ventricosum]RWW68356.1 hypothetical protein BHE74_00024110 [Ensete ventricosum]